MLGAVQPDFEAVACTDALRGLLSLPPTVLNHVSKRISDFNRLRDDEIDEIETRQLISELAFVYFLIPIAIRSGHVIFRGRSFESSRLLSTVQEFYAPAAELAVVQRVNGHGESVFTAAVAMKQCFQKLVLLRESSSISQHLASGRTAKSQHLPLAKWITIAAGDEIAFFRQALK